MSPEPISYETAHNLLKWYVEAGVDEAIENEPQIFYKNLLAEVAVEREFRAEPIIAPSLAASPAAAIARARELADAANSLDELKAAVENFDGCNLKKTAMNTVFAVGVPNSRLMLIGEAPGAEEDKSGVPFCGAAGELLDKMLAAIGYDRSKNCYISNSLFWRPPGNRQPTPEEVAVCLPFVEKHIALIKPAALFLLGGTAARGVLNTTQGITRIRGNKYDYTNQYLDGAVIPAFPSFHPTYLLNQPEAKKQAWVDLQLLKAELDA